MATVLPTILMIFWCICAKNSATGKKIRSKGGMVGYLWCVVKTLSNEQSWFRYSNVMKAKLFFTLNNINEVTCTFLCLCNDGNVTNTFFMSL